MTSPDTPRASTEQESAASSALWCQDCGAPVRMSNLIRRYVHASTDGWESRPHPARVVTQD